MAVSLSEMAFFATPSLMSSRHLVLLKLSSKWMPSVEMGVSFVLLRSSLVMSSHVLLESKGCPKGMLRTMIRQLNATKAVEDFAILAGGLFPRHVGGFERT